VAVEGGVQIDAGQHVLHVAVDADETALAGQIDGLEDVRRINGDHHPLHSVGQGHGPDPLRELALLDVELGVREVLDVAEVVEVGVGYDAEEQRVREAVLKQFPSITVGINRATDTSDITTRGYNIALSLPLFNRGRGDIAIETATRQKLFDEYQSRLAATRSDVDRIRADLPVIERQLQDAERDAGRLREAQQAAERAFAAGNLDWNTYLTLSTSAVARRVEIEQLALAWSEQKSALQSLLGTELPTFPTPEPQR